MGRLTAHLPKPRSLAFATTGVLAAIGGIASAHLVAGLTNPAASPVLAVGSVVIDATPTPVKEYAVAHFGTADKPILLATVTLVTLVAAAAAGMLSRRRVWLGIGFIVLLTGLATAAALTRPVAELTDAVPGVVSTVVGLAILLGLRRIVSGSEALSGSEGITDVEVSVDDGPWQKTKLGPEVGLDLLAPVVPALEGHAGPSFLQGARHRPQRRPPALPTRQAVPQRLQRHPGGCRIRRMTRPGADRGSWAIHSSGSL